MRVAVFVSAGLGDSLLLVPLIKELKKKQHHVTGIFTSSFKCEQLFFQTQIFDEIFTFHNKKIGTIFHSIKFLKKYDLAFLNQFAATRKNIFFAGLISKKIITNNLKIGSRFGYFFNMEIIPPLKGIHDATQNLRLMDREADDSFLKEKSFLINFTKKKTDQVKQGKFPKFKNYVAVQISTGNNLQHYKNWPAKYWVDFLKLASEKFPLTHFILTGEPREKELGDAVEKENIPRVISMVGKTEIHEVVELIRDSEMFVGLDGGLMHLASALGISTFTLWGASDFNLYGYEKINPEKHKIIFNNIGCRPCNSWIEPNTSRVKNPSLCPDFICMKNLKPAEVFSEFQAFYIKSITTTEKSVSS